MAPAPTLAVQIVNYRTRSHLERCLATVAADLSAGEVDYEINLLDNDSGESLDDLAAQTPHTTARAAPRNLGFGGGHNLLASGTGARFLWLLNPDVELCEPGTAQRLLAVFADRPDAVAAGPRLVGVDGAPQRYDHGRLRGPRATIALRAGHSYWRATDASRDVAWVSGAALLVDHAAFDAAGGFDENLFLYKEEEDLCVALRAAGGRIRYEPSVTARHVGQVTGERDRWRPEAERYYIDKHVGHGRVQRAFEAVHHGLAYVHL